MGKKLCGYGLSYRCPAGACRRQNLGWGGYSVCLHRAVISGEPMGRPYWPGGPFSALTAWRLGQTGLEMDALYTPWLQPALSCVTVAADGSLPVCHTCSVVFTAVISQHLPQPPKSRPLFCWQGKGPKPVGFKTYGAKKPKCYDACKER